MFPSRPSSFLTWETKRVSYSSPWPSMGLLLSRVSCSYGCARAHTHTHVHTHTHLYIYIQFIHIYIYNPNIDIYIYIDIDPCIHGCMCKMHACGYACLHVCMYVCIKLFFYQTISAQTIHQTADPTETCFCRFNFTMFHVTIFWRVKKITCFQAELHKYTHQPKLMPFRG